MRHWFINSAGAAVSSWLEALPEGRILDHSGLAGIAGGELGIVWYRLPSGTEVGDIVAEIRQYASLPIVVMSDAPQDAEAARAFAAGASGYCNTHAAPQVLRQIAVVVENGGLWLGPSLLQRLAGGTSRLLAGRDVNTRERWSDKLSEREREVALSVANGASNREIAEQLDITERTVKAHLGAIFEKLGVRDRLQLSVRVNGLPA